jgi:hypothetical protein
MTNGDVPESYGVCDECKNPIDWPEEVTYLFDKPVHTKCYPNEGEIQRRLNPHTSRTFVFAPASQPDRHWC